MRQNRRTSQVSQSIAVSVLLLAALFLLPLAVVAPFRSALFGREEPVDETEREEPPPPVSGGDLDAARPLRVLDGEEVLEMDLGTYLVGVVRAEMPASFELEALKAQAVALGDGGSGVAQGVIKVKKYPLIVHDMTSVF